MIDHDARRAIAGVESKLGEAIDEIARAQQKTETEVQQKKVLDGMIERQGKLLDKAVAYTNLIMIGGYAGIFTVWSATRKDLSPKTNIAVAVAAGISLTAFIVFEVYKMWISGKRLSLRHEFLTIPPQPDVFLAELQKLQQEEARISIGLIPVWNRTLAVCVVTALVAIGILGYNFFAILLSGSVRPA